MTETDNSNILFQARPSLRRAFFIAFCYMAVVSYGRFKTELDPALDPVWQFLFGLLFVLLGIAVLRRWTTLYSITTHDVRAIGGILARRLTVAPHNRITNISSHQGLLERILGLVNLCVDTAGGDVAEVVFARITKTEAQAAGQILRKIIERQSAPPAPQQTAASGI